MFEVVRKDGSTWSVLRYVWLVGWLVGCVGRCWCLPACLPACFGLPHQQGTDAEYSELLSEGWVAVMKVSDDDETKSSVAEGSGGGDDDGDADPSIVAVPRTSATVSKGLVPLHFLTPESEAAVPDTSFSDNLSDSHTHAYAFKAYDGARTAIDLPAAVGDLFRLEPEVSAMPGYVMVRCWRCCCRRLHCHLLVWGYEENCVVVPTGAPGWRESLRA